MKIKYCTRNMKNNGTKPVYKSMKSKFPDVKMKKKDCLGNCKTCKNACFVMIKSETVSASSADKLYKELKRMIG